MFERIIPSTMATQHPDNSQAPVWERDGDGYVSVGEEPAECAWCFDKLGVDEFMWDWEGKYADEAVIDRLFTTYYSYFKQHQLGKDKFLTFRLPNIWHERGYSLLRALMVILTSEDFARDLGFHSPPLFEAILPMTERAEQLAYIQQAYAKLARFKVATFNHQSRINSDYLEIIPLIEGIEEQSKVGKLLARHVSLHRKYFSSKPGYVRPFLARSDPALVSGMFANVLANKLALDAAAHFSQQSHIPVYPIIGAGSLPFRGGLNPERVKEFCHEYRGVRTVTIQSAFRYDYPLSAAKRAVVYLKHELPRHSIPRLSPRERVGAEVLMKRFAASYRAELLPVLRDLAPLFKAVPARRERRQHIGLLGYGRTIGKRIIPRAINFTAALYSLGVPPEFIGAGNVLAKLNPDEMSLLSRTYLNWQQDLRCAGQYLSPDVLERLARRSKAWQRIRMNIQQVEQVLGCRFSARRKKELTYGKLARQVQQGIRRKGSVLSTLVTKSGKLRQSLG